MKFWKKLWTYSVSFVAGMLLFMAPAQAKSGPADDPVAVTTTVTASIRDGKRMPAINADDVVVKRGKDTLRVTEWVPAQGNRAGLDLFILIDDASDPKLGGQLDDLKEFINRQPASTVIGVGYMRNATVQIVQPFTRDHARAANALRMPLGNGGAFSSPYLLGRRSDEALAGESGSPRSTDDHRWNRPRLPALALAPRTAFQSRHGYRQRCCSEVRHHHPHSVHTRCGSRGTATTGRHRVGKWT